MDQCPPCNEHVTRYGPFLMNTETEIGQAIRDWQPGTLTD
ncbi:MAG: hypothetical protein GXP62_01495 [Oligoflexia bacterium]|nr:hypothetical protein [Oligoflexia bacterium]